ncbi:MAG: lipopolysaccharide heptosyltransferase-I [Bdellovibrio sp. ArHS]|uniref:glycosyltransferase family 9 protein n=1 Tax=Bdellovibrio sp. ArHS TaxID=1569284 RepID=UPI00058343AD|nr:glycosyltransferase family 9 protein [Bdellovibrio sp. ArHS]KHD89748.1 MAG: lipopolysaccharide heptosyltransferase-I [Bdellovibrio sp. ArHS]
MKILVLSLLRLGDIIQQAPLLKGLREKNPDAEIHLLLNRQFANVEKILDGVVDEYIYFEREALQKSLGDASCNILWSYQQVEKFVESLNSEGFDQVINLTHNKLSAYLMGTLNVPDKRGLYQQEGRFQGLSNRWLRYFNDRFSGTQKSLFHYVELLGKAFDIPIEMQNLTPARKSKLVLLQCLTSDQKKNWGLDRFQQLKRTIEISLVDYEVMVLGAAFERDTLLEVFPEKDLLICDLPEARKHLQNAALLISGDTSIKHMAAQLGTPIVEIAIGSSDPAKTAAYSSRAVVIQTQVACAPCAHSQACPQPSHLCAEDVSVEQVFGAVWDQLSGEKMAQRNLQLSLEKAVWTLYLDKANAQVEPFYASAVAQFLNHHPLESLKAALPAWNERTADYRRWLEKANEVLPTREELAIKRSFQTSDIADLILCAQEILKSKKDEVGYFQVFVEALLSRFNQPVQIYDRVAAALQDVEELLSIRESFTRHLQTISMEGAYYAKGIGQLSIGGFEEIGKGLQPNPQNAEL